MDDIINRIVKLPLATKVGILAGLVVAITGLNYWQVISKANQTIQQQERRLRQEQQTLVERQTIANNLNEFRRQMEELEQKLAEALTEMPAETRMDDLLSQLAEIADKAGLAMSSITPQPETREGTFYYRIPVRMQVEGTYHEIAVFLDMVSKLRRIINVTNIQLTSPRVESEKVMLQATYLATTFRFSEQADSAGGGSADRDQGRRR
jgi:type IV pilus assembly protein PilO